MSTRRAKSLHRCLNLIAGNFESQFLNLKVFLYITDFRITSKNLRKIRLRFPGQGKPWVLKPFRIFQSWASTSPNSGLMPAMNTAGSKILAFPARPWSTPSSNSGRMLTSPSKESRPGLGSRSTSLQMLPKDLLCRENFLFRWAAGFISPDKDSCERTGHVSSVL